MWSPSRIYLSTTIISYVNDITITTSLFEIMFVDDITILYSHPEIVSKTDVINKEPSEISNGPKQTNCL